MCSHDVKLLFSICVCTWSNAFPGVTELHSCSLMENFALPVYSGKRESTCTGYPAIIGLLLCSLRELVYICQSHLNHCFNHTEVMLTCKYFLACCIHQVFILHNITLRLSQSISIYCSNVVEGLGGLSKTSEGIWFAGIGLKNICRPEAWFQFLQTSSFSICSFLVFDMQVSCFINRDIFQKCVAKYVSFYILRKYMQLCNLIGRNGMFRQSIYTNAATFLITFLVWFIDAVTSSEKWQHYWQIRSRSNVRVACKVSIQGEAGYAVWWKWNQVNTFLREEKPEHVDVLSRTQAFSWHLTYKNPGLSGEGQSTCGQADVRVYVGGRENREGSGSPEGRAAGIYGGGWKGSRVLQGGGSVVRVEGHFSKSGRTWERRLHVTPWGPEWEI